MAHMPQTLKKTLAEKAKPFVKTLKENYGIKTTFGVRHHSTLIVKLSGLNGELKAFFDRLDHIEGSNLDCLDFDGIFKNATTSFEQMGEYRYTLRTYRGTKMIALTADEIKLVKFFADFLAVLNSENYDNSDSQVDYFDVGYYLNVFFKAN